MARRTATILALLAVVAIVPACTKISEPAPAGEALAVEQLPGSGVVPEAWGTLVDVGSVAEYPHLAQMWFQDREGNIRLVVLDLSTDRLLGAMLIRRK